MGPWQLQEAKGFVGQPELGYALIYRHHQHPEVLASLYVYPAGRVDPDQALEQQIGEIRRSLEYLVEQGNYDQVRFGKVRRFDLPLADDDPVRQVVLEAQRKADLIREELGAAGGDTPARARFRMPDSIPGRRMDARVVLKGVPYESRGYVLYRSLYYYKGRFSAPRAAISPRQLDRLAEEAMALAVSWITVDSTGSCADSTINVNPEGDLKAQLVAGVLGQEIRQEAERCREKLDESVPEGYRLLSLEFLPHHWK
ncbi:hypothetical protein [Arenimonas fontis]|uniref:Uncharacterized protein n=1 Tax=Arenimonas fontis TaxID=2608255 RepID=A0A5B2Z894_9GAMM|nr:hypothetical protein [Arenimonas fontis]KAA2284107.1 hypothetical protein F0415_10865 [Arenimonas fontis]